MRLFVAIPLPAGTRSALIAWTKRCGAQPGLRWTPAEQLHITLQFLGEIADDRVGAVAVALDGVAGAAFPVSLVGVEALGRAGVLAASAKATPAFTSLAEDVRLRLRAFLQDDSQPVREFRPHVTLARARRGGAVPKPGLLPLLPELTFTATCLRLYRSELSAEGARHTVIREWALQAGRG